MTKNFIGLIAAAAAVILGYIFHVVPVTAIGACAFAFFFVLAYRDDAKRTRAGNAQIKSTDAQLRTELTATHKLALARLSGADEATKGKVIDLLVEAGMHLGNPYTNSRVVYSSEYFINWNQAGIDLVGQAKKLIDDYVASQPKS